MIHTTRQALLQALFELAREDRPANLFNLASHLSARHGLSRSCAEVDALLVELERQGLVDAERVRLTMAGLVVAASARKSAARGYARRRRAAA